jgi:hypothetical protein
MLTREELLIIRFGPEAIISVIKRLESIVEEQGIRTVKLKKHGKVLESRLNQKVTAVY